MGESRSEGQGISLYRHKHRDSSKQCHLCQLLDRMACLISSAERDKMYQGRLRVLEQEVGAL
jgi:hypothetical protein